jgi:hypothetical protein
MTQTIAGNTDSSGHQRRAWLAIELISAEKGTVPFCSADCAKSGQSPTVLG